MGEIFTMNLYQFPITLQGEGNSPEEAWEHAVECFSVDPGIYFEFTVEKDNFSVNIDKNKEEE